MNFSVTQQTPQNVGFRSSNATCFSQGETLREQVGNRKGAVAPQPTHFYFLGLTEPYCDMPDRY
ncbi:hypothetical protein [Nostoc sp. LPT]|uniref:hypothetical protein n=1 Tax=Nostoc sp. LPT TaxID=2815387 RepID=UPI001DC90EFD|nr:hypothetical protein [Nostoc sp. LPT]MBN4000478.1 hypothetical protein [Nostoc sp. LPT]